jgi:eukaryotic-like serine/threonine-protein kinase
MLPKAYQSGEVVGGKYTLREKLGEGGMGSVFRAYNDLLEVEVALKLIRTESGEFTEGSNLGDRLLQEARAAARLGHPAIARVFDFGTTDRGDPYIVMELLKGEDLADALTRRGRVNASKAVSTLLPIAHALATAHAAGIVHRDLKPENVYLARSEDGSVQPKLVDFGIAKVERNKNHRLTQAGTMLGSPVYMSPEQAKGEEVDHRADIWALCVLLYEMVAGRPPFDGANYNALLFQILSEEPPSLSELGVGDDELWEVLERGLTKDREQRWNSMRELGEALARWLLSRGVTEDITGSSLVAQWLREASGADVLTSMLPLATEGMRIPEIPRAPAITMTTLSPPVAQSTQPGAAVHLRKLAPLASASLVVGALFVAGLLTLLRSPTLLPSAASEPTVELELSRQMPRLEEARCQLEPDRDTPVATKPVQPPPRAVAPTPTRMPLRRDLYQLPKPKLKNPFDNH